MGYHRCARARHGVSGAAAAAPRERLARRAPSGAVLLPPAERSTVATILLAHAYRQAPSHPCGLRALGVFFLFVSSAPEVALPCGGLTTRWRWKLCPFAESAAAACRPHTLPVRWTPLYGGSPCAEIARLF
jgi:hypothetical protein